MYVNRSLEFFRIHIWFRPRMSLLHVTYLHFRIIYFLCLLYNIWYVVLIVYWVCMILNTVAYRWRYYYTLDIILLTCNASYPLLVVFNTYCVESLFCFASSCVPFVASFSGLFLFCFSSSCVPYVASFSGLFLFCFSSSCVPYVASFSGLSFFGCPFGIFYVYSLLTYFSLAIINVRENGRGNQEWTIQRNRQHWTHKTTDKFKENRDN